MFESIRKHCWFSLFCAATIIVLLTLGTWQVQRLQWKDQLIADIEAKKHEEPRLFDSKGFKESQDLYRTVVLKGYFLPEYSLYLSGKYISEKRDKNELGKHVITPFRLENGEIILVNRGWAPTEYMTERPEKIVRQTIHAMVRRSTGTPPWFFPQNQPEKALWLWIDAPLMVKRLKEEYDIAARPILLQQVTAPDEEKRPSQAQYPVVLSSEIDLYNQHLAYAITWYLIALAVAGMFVFYIRKDGSEDA